MADEQGSDAEGYGYSEHQPLFERMLDDARTLSPAGIERVADGWRRHAGSGTHQSFLDAERAALHVIEQEGRGSAWDEARNRIRAMTEGDKALIAWRAEHGENGHHAERALYAATVALLARSGIDRAHYEQLIRPLAEALPWVAG